MSLAETVNLLDNTSVVLDLEESAMKPVIGDSVDSDLVGRSLEQNIPYWDDERVFQRAVSNTTTVPYTHLTWHNVNVRVIQPGENSNGLVGSCVKRTKQYLFRNKHKNEKRNYILKDVFGRTESGELLAILGSSGSGKTTLLNVLTKRNLNGLHVDGVVSINGQQLDASEMRRICAYVQQDDLFVGSMTVKEHLTFYAALRMGNLHSYEERKKRVEETMRDLGLIGCANSFVGLHDRVRGISGGERKRLAFACEILTSPPLIFCDEPTSGLDAFLAQQVVQVLKRLTHRKGMSIVVTIHQPSSQVFAMFDRIQLMAEGRVAFNGRSVDAIEMWNSIGYPLPKNYNPSDHFLKTIGTATGKHRQRSIESINKICDHFVNSNQGKQVLEEAMNNVSSVAQSSSQFKRSPFDELKSSDLLQYNKPSSWLTQMRYLIWRSFLTTVRNPVLLRVRLFQTVIIGVLIGLVYLGTSVQQSTILNINGVLFTLVCNMNYLFQFVVVEVFCVEMPIFLREHANGLYRTDTYFIAKNLAEAPQYIALPLLFTSILYWMAGLAPVVGAFALCCLINVLMANTAISIGYAASCIFEDISVAISVMPAFVLPAMAFAGFFINQDTLPIYFIYLRFLSYFGYAYESLVINEWSHVDYIPGCANKTTCLETGADVIESLSFNADNLYPDILALLIMTIIIRVIAFIALYIRASRRK